MKKIFLILLLGTISSFSLAWDGSQYEKNISFIQMDGGYIYVSLKDVPTMCTGGTNSGVLKHNNNAHKNMLAILLSAKMAELKVDIHSNMCTSPRGYCCIGHVTIRDKR